MGPKKPTCQEAPSKPGRPKDDRSASTGELQQRLEKMKSDMREYEKRMSDSWKPPCVLAGLRKPEEFLVEKRIKRLNTAGKTEVDSLQAGPQILESKYLQRISYLRSSLESKKREIQHLLTSPDQSPSRVSDLPFTYSKVNTIESNPRLPLEGTFPVSDLKSPQITIGPRIDFSEITELRSEQLRLRADMTEMQRRLSELERRTTKAPFPLADEAEDCSSSGKDSKRTSCSRYSFGKPVRRQSETRVGDHTAVRPTGNVT